MKKLLVILGPTSTGKTDLALILAKKFNGELVSCDSRQVYRDLDIGTGKMPGKFRSLKMENGRWIVDNIPIYLYDVINPKKQYTVYDYVKKAEEVINKIQAKNKLAIIVGGTGLYLKGLLSGFSNLGIPVDKKLRRELEKLTKEELQKKLKEISLIRWEKLNSSDKENPRRLVRAIELEIPPRRNPYGHLRGGFNSLKIGLTASREILNQRIDGRVISRINQGMIEEAKSLHENGLSLKRMKQLGLEYGVLADFLQKNITKEELVKILQRKIHSYAKRQMTWFKKEKDIKWFSVIERNYASKVEKKVSKWYYQANASQD